MDRSEHVLVVDDDVDMVEVMELVLRDAGYATRTALNGKQALHSMASAMPALILLDMLMPVMDGRQFAREMRLRYGDAVPFVIVSAAEHLGKRCEGMDAAGVLAKPFEVDDLLRVVARHVPATKSCG